MHKAIGNEGHIVVYNQYLEQGALRAMGTAFPAYCYRSEKVIPRLVDLLIPFRSFHYYHPLQRGSASIKSVLPAITGQGYEGLAIADGQTASLAFLAATYGDMPLSEKARVRADLERYCHLDTEGMVQIVKRMGELTA